MNRTWPALCIVGLLSAILAAGCGTTRPLKEITIADEAARYGADFERDMRLGRYRSALSDARKALAANRTLDREAGIAVSLNNLATVQERLGLPEAEQSYREAVRLSREAGEPRTLAVSLNNLASMLVEARPDEADSLALEALDIGRPRSWAGITARSNHVRCRTALERGALEKSRQLCTKALELASAAGEKSTRAACLVTLGRLEVLTGNSEAAEQQIMKALAIDRDLADPYSIAVDYSRLAEVQEIAGDTAAAEQSRKKAEEILGILGIDGADGAP